ncbi:MAG: RNA polymerase sigma factor [Pseudomonadota bacterium]
MKQAEEDLLVLAAQQGNEAAFNYLFRHYFAPLRRFAYQLGADADSAQDAVQEAWIGIAKSLHRLQDVRAFRSWIFRAVRWKVLERVRNQRLQTEPLDEQLHSEFLLQEDAGPAGAERADPVNRMEQAMAQLPAIDRQALHLFYLQEMRVSEIAIALELPAGTVKSRLHRARQSLKTVLEAETDEAHEEQDHEH